MKALRIHSPSSSQASCRGVRHYEARSDVQRLLRRINELQDAINLLKSRRRTRRPQSKPEVAEGLEAMPEQRRFRGKPSLSGMKAWLTSLGHSVYFGLVHLSYYD